MAQSEAAKNYLSKNYKKKQLLLPITDWPAIDSFCKAKNVSFNRFAFDLIRAELEKNGIHLQGTIMDRQHVNPSDILDI